MKSLYQPYVLFPLSERHRNQLRYSIQTVIISRFLINLRRTHVRGPAPSRPSGIRSSIFRIPDITNIVEDMGQALDHGILDSPGAEGGVQDIHHAATSDLSFARGTSSSGPVTQDQKPTDETIDAVGYRAVCHDWYHAQNAIFCQYGNV